MTTDRRLEFDRRMLIAEPYIPCPQCGRAEFGVLTIDGQGYSRRCRVCLHTAGFTLPALRKRVVLLDQFVLSNIVFALRSDFPEHARVRQCYSDLFELLDRLVALQLIVCPTSPTHYQESVVSRHYDALNRIGEHLGNGCSFWPGSEVCRFQLSIHCWNWVQGTSEEEPSFSVKRFVHGDLNAWTDRILISVERGVSAEDITAIREHRDRVSDGLRAIFSRWQTESLSFDERFMQELASFGPATFRQYQRFYDELDELQRGLRPPSADTLFPPASVVLVNSMVSYLQGRGVSESESVDAVVRYLHSGALRYVPYLRIGSLLWAALARKALSGQRRPPSQGMNNDVEMASAVLPYVDAALLDNEVRGLLSEEPLRSRSGITAGLFSPNNIEEFLAYLGGLLAETPADHLELVRSIYGEEALRPYRDILHDDSQSEEPR